MTKPLEFLSDRFAWLPFRWDIQRNDEFSGSGDGRVWQAELAPPLWVATVSHDRLLNSDAEVLDAIIRSLRGAQEPFLLRSSLFCGPKHDRSGALLGNAAVMISGVLSRKRIVLSGLPGGYVLAAGDKIEISRDPANPANLQPFVLASGAWNDNGFWHDSGLWSGVLPNLQYAFCEASADVVADGTGTVTLDVFPNLPSWVVANMTVKLVKPACRVVIVPGSYSPGAVEGRFVRGGSFKVVQKR